VHRDQKIGLSLGVLLVGFAGAFCFRNEPLGHSHPLSVERVAALDTRIEQLPVRAYTQREGVERLRRQPDLLVPVADLVDASFVDHPIQAIALEGDTMSGDVVELFAGPPEPMRAVQPATAATADVFPPPLPMRESAIQTSAARSQRHGTNEPVEVISPDIEQGPQPPAPGAGGVPPEQTYVVKSGDTLSGVSLRMYGNVGRYLEIFQANRDVLRDPDDLPVGTTLRIPQAPR
jgi:LysM repeat protein